MTRGGKKKKLPQPERKCLVTGEVLPKNQLLRFVVGPDDIVVPDVAEKLPGRGLWVCPRRSVIDKAVRSNLFSKGAKKPVKANDDLSSLVEELLTARVIELLSLARKSGNAIAGFEKVKAVLVNETALILLQASDGSPSQKGKLRPPSGENRYISCLSGQEMGLAFGRENVIHAALTAGGLTRRVVEDAAKLADVREVDAP
jgi:predicted RNA-binding protein YlxR (DUF448 family)